MQVIYVEFKNFRTNKDKTIRWQYFTINLIRQNLKRLSEEALFFPRGAKSFPEIAVQGQHPEREEGKETPGSGREINDGLMCLDDVTLKSLGQKALKGCNSMGYFIATGSVLHMVGRYWM